MKLIHTRNAVDLCVHRQIWWIWHRGFLHSQWPVYYDRLFSAGSLLHERQGEVLWWQEILSCRRLMIIHIRISLMVVHRIFWDPYTGIAECHQHIYDSLSYDVIKWLPAALCTWRMWPAKHRPLWYPIHQANHLRLHILDCHTSR